MLLEVRKERVEKLTIFFNVQCEKSFCSIIVRNWVNGDEKLI